MGLQILEVLEAVARYGPATLDELEGKLPRTRSSVYRSLTVLEKAGWVRRSINRRSFMTTQKVEALGELTIACGDDVSEFFEALEKTVSGTKCLLSIVTHLRGDEFAVLDSTQCPWPGTLSCKDELEVLTDVIHAMRGEKMIVGNFVTAPYEARLIHQTYISDLRRHGYIFARNFETGIVPVVIRTGELLFILCRTKSNGLPKLEIVEDTTMKCFNTSVKMGLMTFKKDKPAKMSA